MKRRLAALAVSASFFGAAPAVAPVFDGSLVAPSTAVAKSCSAGWKHAVLRDGSHKCLRGGQFCATRHESVYRSKGFTCQGGRLKRS